jgi:hypothetical protein
MTRAELQDQCEAGQRELMATNYLAAERILAAAEQIAWDQKDFDSLARLYMPLQEARRQRRQRCGEGTVHLALISNGPHDHVVGRRVVENYPFGQLLVAGWGTIAPAVEVRRLQREHDLYVETFLAAAYPTPEGRAVVVVPHEAAALPDVAETRPVEQLRSIVGEDALIFRDADLPPGPMAGDTRTYATVMGIWERLHLPFLAHADANPDPLDRMSGYRETLAVDYACELAHQKLSAVARTKERERRGLR